MAQALSIGGEARGTTAPNPNVGCVIVRDGGTVGRGATQPGGRPHAEAVALAEAGERAAGGEAVGEKIPVGEMGFAASFKDTEGNVMGLWESASPS